MKTKTTKKYFIQTYGCQANIADSKMFAKTLESLGFKKAKAIRDSDVFVINTCSVRQKSEDKVYGLGQKLKNREKRPFTILAGCMVGSGMGRRKRYPLSMLLDRMPWIDACIKPGDARGLVDALKEVNLISSGALVVKSQLGPADNHVFVNISTGCDNFCSYCVVPYARGPEVSRSKEEILDEVKLLVKNGTKKVTLCGQNANSWGLNSREKFKVRAGGSQKLPFADLLRGVHAIRGLEKIEFMSSNPFDFTNDLVKTLKLPKISPYLHIAVQSGNNDVLKRMNRRHTVEEFISLINSIKKVRPNMRLGTDIIVGFPGETKKQFMDTVKLFQTVKFDVAFISMYSARDGTHAAKMYEDDVSLSEKRRRHAYLTKIWKASKG